MAVGWKAELSGLQVTLEAMGKASDKIFRKYARRGFEKAARVVAKEVKAHLVPGHGVETGLLKASIGQKVWSKKTGDQFAVGAVIGPRKNFKQSVRRRGGRGAKRAQFRRFSAKEKAAGATSQVYRDPVKYAALVEFGHGGPHPAGPKPFMRPAFGATKGAAQEIVAQEIASGIEREGVK